MLTTASAFVAVRHDSKISISSKQAPTVSDPETGDFESSSLPTSLEWLVAGEDPRFELGQKKLEVLRPPYVGACDPENVFVDNDDLRGSLDLGVVASSLHPRFSLSNCQQAA